MDEIGPGVWHWQARRESIGAEGSCYRLVGERVLIDPMIPAERLGWFTERGAPEHLILTNRHHDRDALRLHEAFGCTVYCIANGAYELDFDLLLLAHGDPIVGGARDALRAVVDRDA
jgi:hypothetical protein